MAVAAFLRIDDLGSSDPLVLRFLWALAENGVSYTCGVVPRWISHEFRDTVERIKQKHESDVEIHQHGFAHIKHNAPEEPRFEFGASRALDVMRREIYEGRAILEREFGRLFVPVFSPPYGHLSPEVEMLLSHLGFAAVTTVPGDGYVPVLPDFRPTVDWFQWIPRREKETGELAREWRSERVGGLMGLIMHPRHMTASSLEKAPALVAELFAEHRSQTFRQLWEVRGGPAVPEAQ